MLAGLTLKYENNCKQLKILFNGYIYILPNW